MVELGYFLFVLAFILSCFCFCVSAMSFASSGVHLQIAAQRAIAGVFVCVLISSCILWFTLFSHDFSVGYVFRNSSVDMPIPYLFTAFWSALEGSHTLWTLILSFVAFLTVYTVSSENSHYLKSLSLVAGFVLSFMLGLCVTISGPFERMFPVGQFGSGMNPLLQNPYMAIHPPSLFSGYCLLFVPFAYSFAALIEGKVTSDWMPVVRKWTLAAWIVLTIGIFLGGKWAYVELGWAGYWAWDPVENASFMPWLAITSALHSMLIMDKLERCPRLVTFLCMFAFSLTFLGTFITRSGVISSVHSFAESNIGPAYLIYIVSLWTLIVFLVSFRGPLLLKESKDDGHWGVSRETSLLLTNFFLLFLLALVMFGTLSPIIVEAIRGTKISIQQTYFNAFIPWIGAGLIILVAVGHVLRWKKGFAGSKSFFFIVPLVWTILLMAVFIHKKHLDVRSSFSLGLILWSGLVVILEFIHSLYTLRGNAGALWKYQRGYLGSFIIHLGFLAACWGFMGQLRGIEVETNLLKNQTVDFFGYQFHNKGLKFLKGSNVQLIEGQIEAVDQNKNGVLITPTRSKYSNKEELFNEIGIHSTFWHDIYIVLQGFDSPSEKVFLKIHINPAVKFVWTSLVMMLIGTLISLSSPKNPTSKPQKEPSMQIDEWIKRSLVQMGSLFLIFFSLFYDSSSYGQMINQESAPPLTTVDPKLKEIGGELRCPTCQGVSILESETPQSVAMRREIESQINAGRSKDQILQFFKERYGEWILRSPDTHSEIGFWLWGIPVAGFLVGGCLLLYFLKKGNREQESQLKEIENELIKMFPQFSIKEK